MFNSDELVILMPVRDKISGPTKYALTEHTGPHRLLTVVGKPVDEARNELTRQVLALDPVPEVVVWLDDDAWWKRGTVNAMADLLRALDGDVAMLAGGFSRRLPSQPAVARRIAGDTSSDLIPRPPGATNGNCTFAEVVPIAECGLHACAVRTAALRALGGDPFAVNEQAEDLAFCERLRATGFGIMCAPGLSFAHYDASLDLAFLPCHPPLRIEGGEIRLLDHRDIPHLKRLPGVTVRREGDRFRVGQAFEPARKYGEKVDAIAEAARVAA